MEQALALYDPAHASISSWLDNPQILAFTFLFRSLTYLGYLDQARLCRDKAVALARQGRHAHTLAMVLGISCEMTDLARSSPAVLLQQVEEMGALCAEHAFPYWAASALSWRGIGLSALGHGGRL